MVECRSVIYLSIIYFNYIFICYFIYYIFTSNWAVCLNSNYLCMFSEGARMRIWFIALHANILLLRCMDTYVLLFITAVCKTPFTGLKRASERFFTCNKKKKIKPNHLHNNNNNWRVTCMCPFMNFQVFRPCKCSSTSERALKGLFSRVHS